jgi:hypothetical protein
MLHSWYQLIMGDENCLEHSLLVKKRDLCGFDPFDFEDGKLVTHWDPSRATMGSDRPDYDGDPDDLLANSSGLPIFSGRLQDALSSARVAQNDIQYLPVKIYTSTGVEIEGFAIANIIARIPALNYEASTLLDLDATKIDPLTGKRDVRGIGTAALVSEQMRSHDMIRLTEFFPSIFVSERFKRVFEDNQCTGTTFKKVIMT